MKIIQDIYRHISRDSLYRNSFYLMANTFILSVFGFFFWIINARFYTSSQVGLATTLLSLCTLLSSFSLAGINTAITRYLSHAPRKNDTVNTSMTLALFITVIVTSIYLLGVPFFTPKLMLLRESVTTAVLFLLFESIYVQNLLIESIFVAYRSTIYVLVKNTVLSSIKILLPVFLIGLGAYGIFSSFAIATSAAFLLGIFFLITRFKFTPKLLLDTKIITHIARFSLGNYIANFIISFPSLALPILISNTINYKASAYFYIDMMIVNLLYIIPQATSQSLFAEGSHDMKNLPFFLRKSLRVTFLLMLPAILLTVFFGKFILLAFGKDYSYEGLGFLRILALSGILLTINYLLPTILKLKHRLRILIFINALGSGTILLMSWLLIKNSLNGIGMAWITGQGLMSILYIMILFFLP